MNYLNFWQKKPVIKLNFVPEEWLYNLGQACRQCLARIQHDESISLCKCYMFCHEKCFIKSFAPYICLNQQIKCIRCEQQIKLEFTYTVRWVFIRSLAYVLSIFMGLLMWLSSLILVKSGYFQSIASNTFCYTLLAMMLIMLVLAIIYSSRRRQVFLENVKCRNTNMSSQFLERSSAKMKKQILEKQLQDHQNIQNGILQSPSHQEQVLNQK